MEPDLSLNWISSLFSKYRNMLFNPYFIPRLIQNETIQRNSSKVFQSVWITGYFSQKLFNGWFAPYRPELTKLYIKTYLTMLVLIVMALVLRVKPFGINYPKIHITFQVAAELEKRDIRIVQCEFIEKFFGKIQKKKLWKGKKTQMWKIPLMLMQKI